jgi:alkylation response protein AidB-like acyl-CoA dehydrogenase
MYSFEPNEEQQMLIDAARRYAENDLQPAAREADESGELPETLIEKGWELGLLQASVPEEYGGFGEHSAVTGVLAAEALAWGDLAGAMAVMAPATYAIPILMGGSEEQKHELLPPVIEGAWQPYVAALVEPDFDFSPHSLRTTARREGDAFVLHGKKAYVPFADRARAYLVYADLDGRVEAFVVPGESEGVQVGDREKLMGLKALPTFELMLEDVVVPAEARIGGVEGFDGRLAIAASQAAVTCMSVGMSRAAHEYALAYAKEREAFGEYIAQKQSIAFMLAEMITEIESIRLLGWEAAWQLDEGAYEQAIKCAYLAVTGASDMAMMVTDRAVQILGGHGYIREHPVELWMRNGRGIPALTGLAIV